MSAVKRNDPCPCGSGKKYKHCCLNSPDARPSSPAAVDLAPALQIALAHAEAGRWPQAAEVCQQILRLDPEQPDALYLLGMLALQAGHPAAAFDHLMRAVRAKQRFAQAQYHLGLILMQQGRFHEAAAHYRQAIDAAPDLLEAHCNLGLALNHLNQPEQALESYLRALAIREAVAAKIGAAECLQRLPMGPSQAHRRPVLTRAIAEAWRRPEELASAAGALIAGEHRLEGGRFDAPSLAALGGDALLLRLLENATVCDVALERWLTAMRAALLASALEDGDGEEAPPTALALRAALARQCFINEYAWVRSASETAQLGRLRAQVEAAAGSGALPRASQVLALASYEPLHTLPGADTLADRQQASWPEAVRAVWRQQVDEPRQEARLRAGLKRLTEIAQGVSSQVRQQYEENPYPRWTRPALSPAALPLDDRLRQQLPHARFRPTGRREAVDILVAGCGTGRHSSETARFYHGARVLAIDLSANSLAYAMRKSQELGQTNIEYAQADIVRLAALERRFDLIESVGVLHHLEDPETGWRNLVPLLRPGGLMLIGLYSEQARAPVVAARRFIAERGYAPTADGIRACRAAVMGGDCPPALQPLTGFGDFFGLSACRDLLFHEQEHRTSLPAIGALLDRLGLRFVGLQAEPAVLQHFRTRFPEDDAVHDLAKWHAYETEYPGTFVRMYLFWVQKP